MWHSSWTVISQKNGNVEPSLGTYFWGKIKCSTLAGPVSLVWREVQYLCTVASSPWYSATNDGLPLSSRPTNWPHIINLYHATFPSVWCVAQLSAVPEVASYIPAWLERAWPVPAWLTKAGPVSAWLETGLACTCLTRRSYSRPVPAWLEPAWPGLGLYLLSKKELGPNLLLVEWSERGAGVFTSDYPI